MTTTNDYQNLSLKELKLLVGERNIDCKETKQEMVLALSSYDKGKYVYPTTYEKSEKGFVVGISLNNQEHLVQVGKLIEKGEAKSLKTYCNDRVYYWSPIKLI